MKTKHKIGRAMPGLVGAGAAAGVLGFRVVPDAMDATFSLGGQPVETSVMNDAG